MTFFLFKSFAQIEKVFAPRSDFLMFCALQIMGKDRVKV